MLRGSIGCCTRASTTTNATSASTPMTRVRTIEADAQPARRQERSAYALQHPSRDQGGVVWCHAAEEGGHGEPDDADQEDPAPSVPITQRPAEEQKSRQRQQVAGDYPLETGHVGPE